MRARIAAAAALLAAACVQAPPAPGPAAPQTAPSATSTAVATATPTAAATAAPAARTATPGPLEGKPVPALAFNDAEGKPRSLAEFAGKPILLVAFSTVCPHCQREVPRVQGFAARFAARGLVYLPLEANQASPPKIAEFGRKFGMSVPLYGDSAGNVRRELEAYLVPTFFLISADGVVRRQVVGDLPDAEIEQLLATWAP